MAITLFFVQVFRGMRPLATIPFGRKLKARDGQETPPKISVSQKRPAISIFATRRRGGTGTAISCRTQIEEVTTMLLLNS